MAIAEDGVFADAVAPDLEQATAICEAAGLTIGKWDRETTGRITVSAADRVRMAGTGR